jgi:hypothetical protein
MGFVLNLIADVLALLTRFAVFLSIAVIGGIGSAWVMIHSGSRISTLTQGPWVSWPASGRVDADPYTRAHSVRLGLLPLNPSLAMTYHARTDETGERIYSSCDYRVELDGLNAQWWSLAVFDDAGRAIRNAAQRYAYNSVTIVRESDGKAAVIMARDARPGNWLPIGGAGNVTLALSIQDPRWAQQSLDDAQAQKVLPVIRKIACAR